jgi:hypothetical protein
MRRQLKIGGCLLLGVVGLFVQTAVAQWTSVQAAKKISRVVTDPNGKVIVDTMNTSTFYRSRSGSELTVTVSYRADGGIAARTAILYDNEGMAIYSLDYVRKIAYQTARLPSPRVLYTWPDIEKTSLGHATVASLDCTIIPVKEAVGGNMSQLKQIGRACVAPQYDLIVRKEQTITTSGGDTTHTTEELSDIRLGTELDPNLFRVPPEFSTAQAASAAPEPTH